jgi:hypothetical protein
VEIYLSSSKGLEQGPAFWAPLQDYSASMFRGNCLLSAEARMRHSPAGAKRSPDESSSAGVATVLKNLAITIKQVLTCYACSSMLHT